MKDKKYKLNEKDVGFMDDAIYYLENCIHACNHAIESYVMTKKDFWIDIAMKLRRNRSKWMYKFLEGQKVEDERYCLNKHLLACAEALKEMGNRFFEEKQINLAKECFEEAVSYENIVKLLIGGKK